MKVINELVHQFVPLVKQNNKKKNKQRWMNEEVKAAIKKKEKSWENYKSARNNDNLKKYNRDRNEATKVKRKAKERFEMKLVERIKEDKKNFFDYVRHNTKVKVGIGTVRTSTGELTKNDRETANVINHAFQSVFTKEVNNVKNEEEIPPGKKDSADERDPALISDAEIHKAFSSLEDGKASGPDDIAVNLLKSCENSLLKPLRIIYNQSFREGKIPELWRRANVTPIYKKGVKSDPLNYRPVSLMCILCKILEKIIEQRMIDEITNQKWFTSAQHGFTTNRSTVSNLVKFYDGVTEEMDIGHPVDIIFLDLAKAFDSVPHTKLLIKLRSLHIDSRIVNWIEDYLKNRVQRVQIRGEESDWLNVFSGVPQGSVIGPVLFLVYINDIHEGIESKVSIFADDTKLRHRVGSEEEANVLERDLSRLERWSERNGMRCNVEKCSVMHCGFQNKKINYELHE